MDNEEFLGDGLYVSFDGYALTLRAPRLGGDHFVVLEPQVYFALVDYVKRLEQKRAELEHIE